MAILCLCRPLYDNYAKETGMSSAKLNHLLIATPGFPENEQDSTCLPYLQQFILSYKKLHPELKITILSLHHTFDKTSYQWHGMDVYCMMGKNKAGINRLATVYKAYKKGLTINKQERIDAVLSIWVTDAALAAKYIARKLQVPFFAWAWGQEVKIGNKYMKWVNPNEQHLAAMSDYQNEILYQSYGKRAKYVIPNGIIEDVFPTLNTGERKIDMLAVGSLIPLKQYHLFIELVLWLRENGHRNIKAVLAGDGVLKEELIALQRQYKLEKNLEITGSLAHELIFELMNNAKIFVHPSNYEGHSTVMLEALYSGCKVTSFMPMSSATIDNFTQCANMEEMKQVVLKLLIDSTPVNRVLYSTWPQNVTQIHTILTSML
jgi:glycosyltransferase involved in cell wall biosynthesis